MKNLIHAVLTAIALLAVLAPSTVHAESATLGAADRRAIQCERFAIVKTVHQIPKAVRDELDRVNHGAMDMADPGQEFNSTDVVTRTLPSRRLIFAAVNSKYCIVHFEHGGIAYTCPVAIVKLWHHHAKLVGFLTANRPYKDIAALKKAIATSRTPDVSNL